MKTLKLSVLVMMVLASFSAQSQTDSTSPPYQRFPNLPPIKILLSDSSSFFTKADFKPNKAALIMVFSPECSHCQHETEEMIAHKDELKDVQIVMITMHPFEMMKEFISKYKLNEMPNVVVGRDVFYITPGFFTMHNLPFLAMYNKKGELISGFEGSLGINSVIEVFKSNQ
jgi:thioredoxin-related protein